MTGTQEQGSSTLAAVSNAVVKLHKEQFGRGPSNAQAHFAGPDALMCVLDDALLPAERKMVEMGDQGRVRESRIAFQAATHNEFVTAIEQILLRKVIAFGSGLDADRGTVFECFTLEPRASGANGDGELRQDR